MSEQHHLFFDGFASARPASSYLMTDVEVGWHRTSAPSVASAVAA